MIVERSQGRSGVLAGEDRGKAYRSFSCRSPLVTSFSLLLVAAVTAGCRLADFRLIETRRRVAAARQRYLILPTLALALLLAASLERLQAESDSKALAQPSPSARGTRHRARPPPVATRLAPSARFGPVDAASWSRPR
jgi:hypothetical protein